MTARPASRVRIDRIREDLELDLEMLRYLEEYRLLPGADARASPIATPKAP